MKTLQLKEILAHINGVLVKGTDRSFIRHVATHPYQLKEHTLLFDLKHRSHLYRKAMRASRFTVIVTENVHLFKHNYKNVQLVRTSNVQQSYWQFIRYYRNLFQLPVIGVTGTCGKTTTKEMIYHILSQDYNTRATYKSKNSLERNLGYLLDIDDKTDVAVYEMGVASPDDLIHSCAYFQPDIGIITSIGIDHLEHCGTQENYIREKAKLLVGLKNKGILILNADDQNISKIDKSRFKGKIIYYGFRDGVDFQARHVRYTQNGMAFILLVKNRIQNQLYSVYVPGHGEHNVYNAMAAIAAAISIGMDITKVIGRLSTFQPLEKHLQFSSGVNGCTVIDDTWSSNPTSAEAALNVLKKVAKGKKTIAILGKMGLLGKSTLIQHAKIGEQVVDKGIDVLITLDNTSKHIGIRASELGMDRKNIYLCRHPKEVHKVLHRLLDKDTFVLLKTSMLDSKVKLIQKLMMADQKG